MSQIALEDAKAFGHKVRIRACGILIEQNKILLVKHLNLGPKGYLWSPPGGSLEFSETLPEAVKREMLEECGLIVAVKEFCFMTEYLNEPLHSLELFFKVEKESGKLKLGQDPESDNRKIILSDVKFFSFEEILKEGIPFFHKIFSKINKLEDLNQLYGLIG